MTYVLTACGIRIGTKAAPKTVEAAPRRWTRVRSCILFIDLPETAGKIVLNEARGCPVWRTNDQRDEDQRSRQGERN